MYPTATGVCTRAAVNRDSLISRTSKRVQYSRYIFCHFERLSGTVSLSKLDRQTHSHLLNYLSNFTSSSYPIDSLSLCFVLCACAHARHAEVYFNCFGSLFCNGPAMYSNQEK